MSPRLYSAVVVRVVDGDSVLLDLDLGFYIRARLSCRLAGVNAIELSDPGGSEARTYLARLLPVGTVVRVASLNADKYAGRFDGRIALPDGRDASEAMVADGYAANWNGRGPRPVPPWPNPASST